MVAYGQQTAEMIVQEFGNNLRDWCATKDIEYRNKAQEQCDKSCRVNDEIMEDFVAGRGLESEDYVVPNYLNGFQRALVKGAVSLSMRDVKTILADEQSDASSYGESSTSPKTKHIKNYTLVACDITTSGVLNYRIKDLFYLRKGKILKISPYEEVVDQKTGKKKVKVDFSDLDDYETWGFSYNYGKNWPIGLSASYSYSWFMIGADLGINLDKNKLYKHSLEMTDVMNFRKKDIEFNPHLFYLTITPSIYLKYVSIGCGAGILCMEGKEYTDNYSSQSSTSSTENGSVSSSYSSSSYTSESDCTKVKFMLRPTIKGYIPLSGELYLSLSVGYDYAFGYKEKNGINFGLGLQFELW